MNKHTECVEPCRDDSPVEMAIGNLGGILGDTEKSMVTLASRLKPLMLPPDGTKNVEEPGNPVPPSSPLVRVLHELEHRLTRTNRDIWRIINALEI